MGYMLTWKPQSAQFLLRNHSYLEGLYVLKLREYQELASDFIYEHDRSLILAKVGAGKTALTLTAMEAMLKDGIVKRWLVVAPKRVAQHVWPVEAKLWSSLKINVAVGTPNTRENALSSPSDVVVINYDNLQWLANYGLAGFDGVVFDELTKLKNPSGKRFKAFFAAAEHIHIRVGLTGSFTSNGLEDVFGQVRVVDPLRLGRSKGAFMQQYFWCANPQFGEWIPRPNALPQIMERIKPITFLLENKEYADTLPPLHVVPAYCTFNDDKPYKQMRKDMVLEFGNTQITAINAGVVTQKLLQLASGFCYETDVTATDTPGKFKTSQTPHWFDTHKFDALHDLLDENQWANTIIFYNFKEELAELKRRYPKAETLDAPQAIDRWNSGKIPLLLAHPKSAQFGLNLQHGGSQMVFLSLPWSLTDFEQAIGRLHRSGQRHPVYVYCMMTEKTIDETVFDALNNKKSLSEIAVAALENS